ncbi:MAG: hypothetical protein PSV35_01475 [bacterium]|nr:hypothetical protein [bacterium]
MTNNEFEAWISGYIELKGECALNERQIEIIRNHANLVVAVDGFLTVSNQTLVDNLQIGQTLSLNLSNNDKG